MRACVSGCAGVCVRVCLGVRVCVCVCVCLVTADNKSPSYITIRHLYTIDGAQLISEAAILLDGASV